MESATNDTASKSDWSGWKKVLFRIAFIFFILFCIPTEAKWFTHLFHVDWTNLHCRDLCDIARFSPSFINVDRNGAWYSGYVNWGLLLMIGIVGGLIWTLLDRRRQHYRVFYFWLRALVRYRAAKGRFGSGVLPVNILFVIIRCHRDMRGRILAIFVY